MKKIYITILSFLFLLAGQTALASSPWNGMSNDCPTVAIANFTTNTGIVDPCWPLTSVNANPGETVNVRVYYHNSSTTDATNTSITLSQSGTGPANSYSFSGVLKSSQGDLPFGPVTVNANGASGLTFGSAKWYPNHSFAEASFPNGQSGNEIMNGGVNLGTVAPGWATQGSVVISFQVGGASASNCTINSFTPASQTISAGSTVTLSWSTSNCTSTYISGIGNQNANGSTTVSPSSTTTYTLTASGTGTTPSPRYAVINVTNSNNNNNTTPSATTNYPSSISTDRATLSGYVNGNGSLVNGWLEFPCYGAQYGNVYSVNSSSLSSSIYSLNPGSSYTYCAVAQNISSGLLIRGNQMTFNTDSDGNSNNGSLPSVSTYAATNVDQYSATLNGRVNGNGTYTTRWFRYGTSSGYMNMTTNSISNGSGSRSVSDYVSNLNPNTTYYYQTVAQNSYGTIYGSTQHFTTDSSWIDNSNQISVVTTIATNVQQTSASVNGLLMNSGNTSTNVYFEYGTTPNFGQTTNRKYLNAGTSIPFSEYLSNLSPGTLYYYRAVAENNSGTVRGSMEIFRTPAVITNTNTNTTTTRTVYVNTGVTRIGMESPIMLKIENKYALFNLGDTVDYTVTYKNIGNTKLVKPLLQVILPQYVTFMNASRGTYAPENMTLSVPLEDLLPQGEGVVYVQGRVNSLPNNNSDIVSTALLVYTSPSSAQENAIAYVLNHENGFNNTNLGAAAGFLNFWGLGLLGWLLLLILILLIILIARTYRSRYDNTYYAPYVAPRPVSNHTDNQGIHQSTPHT